MPVVQLKRLRKKRLRKKRMTWNSTCSISRTLSLYNINFLARGRYLIIALIKTMTTKLFTVIHIRAQDTTAQRQKLRGLSALRSAVTSLAFK
ncbi:unnamed protein product [Amoebophrya sp. A25]|nr:unnamed protein product [Amoebophrya sp. A25]|eukprot:GSA25T00011273001.1